MVIGKTSSFFKWEQIEYCSIEPKNQNGQFGCWVTLWNGQSIILTQINRNNFRYSASSLRKFDEFIGLLKKRTTLWIDFKNKEIPQG